jgi:SAM-dependent methyltransferase
MATFEELETEGLTVPFSGWDFRWLDARTTSEPLPWRYADEVARYAGGARTMLDMGTGGGEVLATLPRPERTVAAEGWPPNVPIAGSRLRPLGVGVVQYQGAPDNFSQDGATPDRMPFKDSAFDLVISRHESFSAAEVARILAPGGVFVTQQVDYHSYDDLYRLLGMEVPEEPDSWLPFAQQQLADAELRTLTSRTGDDLTRFRDIGAVIYYLRVVGWAVPDYSRERLRAAHADPRRWPADVRQRRFLLVAAKETEVKERA